jgi:hypothetical protein
LTKYNDKIWRRSQTERHNSLYESWILGLSTPTHPFLCVYQCSRDDRVYCYNKNFFLITLEINSEDGNTIPGSTTRIMSYGVRSATSAKFYQYCNIAPSRLYVMNRAKLFVACSRISACRLPKVPSTGSHRVSILHRAYTTQAPGASQPSQ